MLCCIFVEDPAKYRLLGRLMWCEGPEKASYVSERFDGSLISCMADMYAGSAKMLTQQRCLSSGWLMDVYYLAEMERMARTRRKMGPFTQCIYRAVSNAVPVTKANVTMNVALIARERRCWLRSMVQRAGSFEDPLVSKSRR